jgi:fatty-acyl-CoA synthase
MSNDVEPTPPHTHSVVAGPPLSEEPGLGSLTLPGYLREVTARFAKREALVLRTQDGAERWTYEILWERSLDVARALLACGVGKGSRVGILMTNRPEYLSAAFGVALTGGVAVTLSTFSTPPELEHLLQASAVSILLFERQVLRKDFAAILDDLEPEIRTSSPGQLKSLNFPFLRRLAGIGVNGETGAIEAWSEFLAYGKTVPTALVQATAATVQPSDPAMLFFSSGTTSRPKGILSAHRGIAIQLWRWPRIFGTGEVRCWVGNGFFWSGVFSTGIGLAFSRGGTLVLQPTFDAAEALELMEAERVSIPIAWPHQWTQMEEAPTWSKANLASLRYVDSDSPLMRHPTVRAHWKEPRAFGLTETFTICTAHAGIPPADVGASYGEPLPGNTLKIVDPISGETLALGQRGEIAIKGPTLMLGYIGVPLDETLDADGFFHTGDGGYVNEAGRLCWEGRLINIIKTGGANVSPVEVNDALRAHPGLKMAETIGVPHETLGEMVVTCAVPHVNVELDEAEIRGFLKARLASYKVPRRVLFVREDEVSMTGNAKVKSALLRDLVMKKLSSESGASARSHS